MSATPERVQPIGGGSRKRPRIDHHLCAAPIYLRIDDVARLLGVGRTEAYAFLRVHGIKTEPIYEKGPERVRYSAVLEATRKANK